MKKDIDLGYEIPEKPLTGRKHISILIGAGFSAPQGYPIGNTLNENILDFENIMQIFHQVVYYVAQQLEKNQLFKKKGYLICIKNISYFASV